MLPLLALPLATSLAGSVINAFTGGSSRQPQTAVSDNSPSFQSFLDKESQGQGQEETFGPLGCLQSNGLSKLGGSSLQQFGQNLDGRSINATDFSGKVLSGVGSHFAVHNGVATLEIGGNIVNLQQLKQISWSPSI